MCFLGKPQAFARRENYGKLSNCQKCNQELAAFLSSFSRDQRRGRKKEREGKIPSEN